MKFHSFLIKYGEIGIKGKNRYIFEDALVRQIRYALQGVDGEFLVHKCHGRVYVDCDGDYDFDETVESLQKVFGIVGICPVVRVPVAELEQLRKDVVAYVDEAYEEKNMTFKVDARRAKKSYPANSMEINCEVGEAILEAFPEMKVDVMAARDFGQSDSTSVRSPISNPQLPADSAAISPRSSQRPTRIPPSESVRTISRSSVVFPPPGGERINVEGNGRAQNLFPIPFTSRGIRIHTEKRSSRFQRPRSPPGNRPQKPTRTPPSAVMKPRRRQSDAA